MSADSDIAINGRAMKLERQTKRAALKAENTAALEALGIPFASHNFGAHLIVGNFDFWPSTGRFRSRNYGMKLLKGSGLKALLDAMAQRPL